MLLQHILLGRIGLHHLLSLVFMDDDDSYDFEEDDYNNDDVTSISAYCIIKCFYFILFFLLK